MVDIASRKHIYREVYCYGKKRSKQEEASRSFPSMPGVKNKIKLSCQIEGKGPYYNICYMFTSEFSVVSMFLECQRCCFDIDLAPLRMCR